VVHAHPEGADAIDQVCAQVHAGTLGSMNLQGLLQVAARSQAS
jgi:hypothetical protein